MPNEVNTAAEPAQEGLSIITVRLPRELHAALKTEAHRRQTSMNQLCVQLLTTDETPPIKRITVRAGRTVPHPLHCYGNLKADLEIVADLDDGEDADSVQRDLQAKIESDVEQHVADLKDGLQAKKPT